ncbi:MAG: LytTR family DNA-binding domain-containing protein [Gammaproteobacteria bacterium]|nr:LytTR family DNA-binding domain-containing protein [Gammaproteobacteria bacterium]
MKILIVDDEPLARGRLRAMLDNLAHTVVAEAANGQQALEQAEQHQPDIVLMDIRMPGMDGMEAAQLLSQHSVPPAIIFTTAYNDYAVDAFKSQAVDYLLKPVRQQELETALNSATHLNRVQQQILKNMQVDKDVPASITARVQGDIRLVPVEQIFYFQAEHKYVTVGYPEGEVLIEESLVSLEESYPQFIRIHRNALVARTQIRALEKNREGHFHISLRGTEKILEVSRRHLPEVRRWLKEQG